MRIAERRSNLNVQEGIALQYEAEIFKTSHTWELCPTFLHYCNSKDFKNEKNGIYCATMVKHT